MTRPYTILKIVGLLMAAIGGSCQSDNFDELYFIGDSLVEKWDLDASFPTTIARNRGKGGSGVIYLEANAGNFKDKDVVVLSGTNDIRWAIQSSEWPEDYTARFLSAIKALGARHIYLYSVLPRGENFNGSTYNIEIEKLNRLVKDTVESDPTITYLDVYDNLCTDGLLNMEYACDGIHLNNFGYEILAEALDY